MTNHGFAVVGCGTSMGDLQRIAKEISRIGGVDRALIVSGRIDIIAYFEDEVQTLERVRGILEAIHKVNGVRRTEVFMGLLMYKKDKATPFSH